MTIRFFNICLMCLCAAITAVGQQNAPQEDRRLVVLPPDQVMLVIVYQPECPLEFEDAKLLINMKGLWLKSFRLRNRGAKPIRAYTVAAIGTNAWGWEASDSNNLIMPGQLAPQSKGDKSEIVPLTDELREKLKLRGPMKGIVALAVVRVEYADGSTFEEKAYEAQEDFFWKMIEVMSTVK